MSLFSVVYRKQLRVKERTTLIFATSLERAMQEAERRFAGAIVVQAWRLEEAA